MLGELVKRRMRIKKYPTDSKEILNIVRKPNQAEIEIWQKTMTLEGPTMLKARHIATELKLNMKISDVEYQADGTRSIVQVCCYLVQISVCCRYYKWSMYGSS